MNPEVQISRQAQCLVYSMWRALSLSLSLSLVRAHVCALTFMLSFACFHACALFVLLSCVLLSYVQSLMCVLASACPPCT